MPARPESRNFSKISLFSNLYKIEIDSLYKKQHHLNVTDLKLKSPLQYIKGVGPKRAEILAENGFKTVSDILHYYPRMYIDRSSITPIGKIKPNDTVTIIGEVKAHGLLYGKKRRYEVILQDDNGSVALIFFQGVKFWEKTFKKGQIFAASGTVSYFMGHQMVHPELERLEDESDKLIHAGRIIPVYPQTTELKKAGLNSRSIRRITSFIFDNLTDIIPEYLPHSEIVKHNLLELNQAVKSIHFPEKTEDIENSRRRLAYNELLVFQNLVFQNKLKKETEKKKHTYREPQDKLKEFKKQLPFELTSGQKEAVREIIHDLKRTTPMARILQGDVGCGKTVVAVIAAIYASENNLQTAFMVPTEILAEQHHRNWKETLNELGITSVLLTSGTKSAEKEEIAKQIASGQASIVIGTHALIYDYVEFSKLGLVIIDEQHRFGVEQRNKLYSKGENPDLLVMTATPIPRTLTLTLYGDLDISTIKSLPPGRKPIRTVWRSSDVSEKVFSYVRDEVKKGGQVYIVYPLIEKTEQSDLVSVEEAYKELKNGQFHDLKIAMLHGRIKPDKKDNILKDFRDMKIDILMATTVIEVGLDNPNATIMVIEHAERFGLAQLHQLRGRIGRGEKQATLIALVHPPLSEIGQKRLEFFTGTNDGFEIAEADLILRGPGEIFGVRQSGAPELKVTRLGVDQDLIQGSRDFLEALYEAGSLGNKSNQRVIKYLNDKVTYLYTSYSGG